MEIKILGKGCCRCNDLEALTREVLAEMGLEVPVVHLTDFRDYLRYGVMQTPALVVNEKVVLAGRVPSKAELTKILSANGKLA